MSSQTFSSYLMGAESLLVQCAEILLQRGHTVRGVISDNADIAAWARSRSIPVLSPGKGLAERITEDFDWFFSIANLRIIPDAVLAKARQGGVNFHDGPLPRYAGLNAPNWALLNGESPDVNNTTDYDNGVKVVPSYLLESAIVVKDNITEVLVDSGYWTEDEING